jgi:peptidoglycan/LPS O-acetylase OafA/YrhL
MENASVNGFIWGLITMGYLIAGLFFLRFWARTRDGLFAAFAVAFWLLAANQGLVAITGGSREELTWFYLLRLAAFLVIIGAIISKNRRSTAR